MRDFFLFYHIGWRVGGMGLNSLVPEDFSRTPGFLPQFKDKNLAQVTESDLVNVGVNG